MIEKDRILRLQEIQIENFKNIGKGTVTFPSAENGTFYEGHGEIVGIYGQNASGKTSVIEALSLLQSMLLGISISSELGHYVNKESTWSRLSFQFYTCYQSERLLINYAFTFEKGKKEENGSGRIVGEELKYKNLSAEQSFRTILAYDANLGKEGLVTERYYRKLIGGEQKNRIKVEVEKQRAYEEGRSVLFSEGIRTLVDNNFDDPVVKSVFNSLQFYARMNMILLTNRDSASATFNILTMQIRHEEGMRLTRGDFFIPTIEESFNIPEEEYSMFRSIVEQVNLVLQKIVPDLSVRVFELGRSLDKDGKQQVTLEIVSNRKGVEIPFRYESDGVKKIFLMLNALISVYNNPSVLAAIDEIDSGVFEFMLGELLAIMQKGAKGQLIFTSHNLRAMEKLNKESIIVSTANPDKRFMRIPNIRGTNNLRDVYLRTVDLGGLNEEIYEPTDRYAISHAFRKAGVKHEQK